MTDLAEGLENLRQRVDALRFGLATPGAEQGRKEAEELVGQVDDYLLPRLRQLDAPLLAVIGGSTGAGKSTLVNTLVGDDVSKAGWLRPTTRGPVLVCNPNDIGWFTGATGKAERAGKAEKSQGGERRILPELARTTGEHTGAAGHDTLHIVAHAGVGEGIALLDAPDIDSVVEENRRLAGQLLAAADLWLFCTTAARYADAVPWELLRTAQQRSTALAVVLNRVPPEGVKEIGAHLAAMLDQEGLARATLFTIAETPLQHDNSRLPLEQIAPLKNWLAELAGDAEARSEVIRATLDGALQSVRRRVAGIAREIDDQLATAAVLADEAETFHDDALRIVDDAIRSGSVLRGEVLARWQEFVGTGQFTRGLEQRIGSLRDRFTAFVTGRPAPIAGVEQALESSLESLVRAAADTAAEQTVDAWRVRPAGRRLLAQANSAEANSEQTNKIDLSRASEGFRTALAEEIRAWQGQVLELVAQEGGQKRTMARVASFGTNGVGLVLMLAVFAQTGGLTGGEVLIAGGTSAASQKVLEALFGDSAVRLLATRARADLLERVERLLAVQKSRFTTMVDEASPAPTDGVELRSALEEFEQARREARRPGATTSRPASAPTTRPTLPLTTLPTTTLPPTTLRANTKAVE